MLLGWAGINSEGKTSISNEPDNIYYYAMASPEWFAQFTAEGTQIPNSPPYDKTAYKRRNYDAAKQNIELLCQRLGSRPQEAIDAQKAYPNLTEEETATIMEFFDKYWAKFAAENNGPQLALIDRRAVHPETHPPVSFQEFMAIGQKYLGSNSSFSDLILPLISSYNPDMRITHIIDPVDIKIVELPSYESVHP